MEQRRRAWMTTSKWADQLSNNHGPPIQPACGVTFDVNEMLHSIDVLKYIAKGDRHNDKGGLCSSPRILRLKQRQPRPRLLHRNADQRGMENGVSHLDLTTTLPMGHNVFVAT